MQLCSKCVSSNRCSYDANAYLNITYAREYIKSNKIVLEHVISIVLGIGIEHLYKTFIESPFSFVTISPFVLFSLLSLNLVRLSRRSGYLSIRLRSLSQFKSVQWYAVNAIINVK